MSGIEQKQEHREFRQEASSLVRITGAPLVWALHFALSYAAAAVYCAKIAEGAGSIFGLRLGIVAMTVLAFALILWLGWQSWRQWDRIRDGDFDNDKATDEDRHQFLGNAAFLLSIISAVGVVYTSLPAALIESCR